MGSAQDLMKPADEKRRNSQHGEVYGLLVRMRERLHDVCLVEYAAILRTSV